MANDVFANGREISCKAADGKSICAFPDVCFTPPETPPPGVPVPYPNTGLAKDTTAGSKTVKISGKEVMLKNKSYFKKSMGDEAGCAAKKGFVTTTHRGKVYYISWSMNVKVEGENVVRHLDFTTNNHMSFPGNTPPWAYTDTMSVASIQECQKETDTAEKACKGKTTREQQCKSKKCRDAKRCLLVTYSQGKRAGQGSQVGCCPGEQPHHLVEAHCFYEVGARGNARKSAVKAPPGKQAYNDNEAPCVCVKGARHTQEHGQYHAFQQKVEAAHHAKSKDGEWSYRDAREAGVKAHKAINPQCSEECTRAQLDSYHKGRCGMKDGTKLRTDPQAGTRSVGRLDNTQQEALQSHLTSVTGGKLGKGSR